MLSQCQIFHSMILQYSWILNIPIVVVLIVRKVTKYWLLEKLQGYTDIFTCYNKNKLYLPDVVKHVFPNLW